MVYLQEHLKRYPLMQLEDVLKLYLQGILGPAHIVKSFDECLARVKKEYESIEDKNHPKEIEELISDKYVRINLCPYFLKEGKFDLLVKYFVESAKETNDVNEFIAAIKSLINEDNKVKIEEYLNSGDYLISHSQIYKDNYHPHYLVINRKYLKSIYKN